MTALSSTRRVAVLGNEAPRLGVVLIADVGLIMERMNLWYKHESSP